MNKNLIDLEKAKAFLCGHTIALCKGDKILYKIKDLTLDESNISIKWYSLLGQKSTFSNNPNHYKFIYRHIVPSHKKLVNYFLIICTLITIFLYRICTIYTIMY